MENSVDALIMGASVLLLIIALTVTMSSLSNLKNGVQDMISKDEFVELAKDNSGNYINYYKADDNSVRIVEIETVMSTIRRALNEKINVFIEPKGEEAIKITLEYGGYADILDEQNLKSYYEKFKDKKFKEYIGVYKKKADESGLANEDENRIIRYEEI